MIQPNDFLHSADACLAQSKVDPNEAHVRSTISRAYYAAFHHAKTEAASKYGIHVSPPKEHKELVEALQGNADKKLVIAGNRLQKLRDKRTLADYFLNQTLANYEANNALMAARTLINDFS